MNLGDSPFVWLQFDKDGGLTEEAAAIAALNADLAAPDVTDLVVLAHGWKTDVNGAGRLYRRLWDNVCNELKLDDSERAKKIVVAGVLWPSKAFNADYDGGMAFSRETDAAGGAQGVSENGGDGPEDLPDERFETMLQEITTFFGPAEAASLTAAARALVDGPGNPAQAKFEFFEAGRAAIGVGDAADDELSHDAVVFRANDPTAAEDLFNSYAGPYAVEIEPGAGGASGLGDIVKGAFQGVKNGAASALDLFTYYEMKKRAGVVGEALAAKLAGLSPNHAIKVHLVGHSFGARLVTAAANKWQKPPLLPLQSLTLLQGAFSHNAMTTGKGPFVDVPTNVNGPIAMTHTFNDIACSVAYPLASRLSNDTAKRIGDASDPFGAMGANGAQVATGLLAADVNTTAFAPVSGKINRFKADSYVKEIKAPPADKIDAHNNVYNAECGRLVARVITA